MRKSPRGCDRPESSPLFAKFVKRSDDVVFRLDTRIYISDDAAPGNDDKCIAAIVAKNPGSAQPRTYGALSAFDRGNGQLLTFVRNRFKDAFERAGKRIPKGAFVRVWNLFYLREPVFRAAIRTFKSLKKPLWCGTEDTNPPIVWFAWGRPRHDLEDLKERFRARRIAHPFFYDKNKKIVCAVPRAGDFARHTQGLSAEPIVEFLSEVL